MKKILPFGDALIRARRAQGHTSAHAFFTGCGGPRALGITFAAYLAYEHGDSVPRGRALKPLLQALKLLKGAPLRAELLRAYLDSIFEDPELASELSAQPAKGPEPGGRPAEEASRMIKRNSLNLELSQWQAMAKDFDAYLCDYFLQCTEGFVALAEIAQSTGLSAAEAKAACRRLAALGLIELSGDRARCPHTDKLVNIPPLSPATASMYADLRKNRDRMIRAGQRVHDTAIVGRIPADALDRYAQYMMEAIDTSAVYCDSGDKNAGIFAIEARITRVLEPGKKPAAGDFRRRGSSDYSLALSE